MDVYVYIHYFNYYLPDFVTAICRGSSLVSRFWIFVLISFNAISCLASLMDGGAWKGAVHGIVKSRTRLSDFPFTFHFHALEKEWQPTPVFLPGESQGQGSLVGCCLWGHTESGTTEVT